MTADYPVSHRLIAIEGGIGSGKSVVSRVLSTLGYPVYDCDVRAKLIMDQSATIKQRIADEICAEAISCGVIDRRKLSEVVFADADALLRLNALVHSAVRDDLALWILHHRLAFVETAILYQSGIDSMVDGVWSVVAPRELRILRVISRNHLSREAVESRIAAQDSFVAGRMHPHVDIIVNDGDMPVLPQILALISRL